MMAALSRALVARLACFTLIAGSAAVTATSSLMPDPASRIVAANDNRHSAGKLSQGMLTLALRAGRGIWRPEGPRGPGLSVEALGETSSSLMVPAPLVRVEEGTTIVASIRNDLESSLIVHGFCARDGSECATLAVPPGETRQAQFSARRPGTYHYWATSMGAPVPFREMAGALVVDPRGGAVAPDRVLVITEWNNLTPDEMRRVVSADDASDVFVKLHPRLTFVLNGLSWPATERLTYDLGEPVHWRVINLSSQQHPMHLHGFYFEVESLGDGVHDQPVPAADRHPVVTQLMRSGATMTMAWTPEREGNWLFHCHIMNHVSAERRLSPPVGDAHADHAGHDASAGMAGMIIGVTIVKRPSAATAPEAPAAARAPRKLTLVMGRDSAASEPSFGFALRGDGVLSTEEPERMSSPGPVLVLRRNEPVEVTVENQLGESTAIHWHGMELASIYDGVHGWSGVNQNLAPLIPPGGSFVVRFTPPRTGTFMYHTHLHDERQLPLGLYGPMVVVDPDETYNPASDHVLMAARKGVDPAAPNVLIAVTPIVLNGEAAPRFVWKAGQRHRVRLINITPDDVLTFSMQSAQGPATWTPLTKDGAPLPASMRTPVPARQTIGVGETYDFEVQTAPGRENLWVEVRSTTGKWLAQGHVIVK
jgi:FtsP/CotA-like multicopper oxidase with cupredoxin domain